MRALSGIPLLALILLPTIGATVEMPKIVKANGRFTLLVDGQPYLILGAQINNSSAWPSTLPQVWPLIEAMHVNTVEAPVYWEQLEPRPGVFDFSIVDALIDQSREHHVHLVLLWFGTWKNGQMHYAPEWVKADTSRYPRVINSHGEPIDVLSANSPANLEADLRAFTALMHHLREADSDRHTILFVQVENESGAIGSVRDFSPAADKQFRSAVPTELVRALHKQPGAWSDVFGADADEYFQAWSVARYINAIAEAGKREFPLPMYVNVWLSYPVQALPERRVSIPGLNYPSGGAVQKVIDLWKTAAPSIDMIGPDIYTDDSDFYCETLRTYSRPDNPLWIPETGMNDTDAHYFFYALGLGAIGFSPFGIDRTGWTFSDDETPKLHAENYALIAPMDREIARLNSEGKLKTAVEEPGALRHELDFGGWQATVSFGFPQRDGANPPGTTDHRGRAFVAQLAPDEFLVAGFDSSISFHLPGKLPGQRMNILRAEEGQYENGAWKFLRIWNGDQTDRGLNFKHPGTAAVRVRLARF
jgi:beta-galactosidase GanA